jgi:phosphate transport system protein
MYETRHGFHRELDELEARTLEGLEFVVGQLDRALESVRRQDVELAAMVIADDDRIDGRYDTRTGKLDLFAAAVRP